MTPQASFMAVAPITPGREDELRKLLASMNHRPGVADPDNPLVPFGRLAGVHFARFVILDDATLDDVTAHGVPRVDHRPSLAFLADFDGPVNAFLDDLLRIAGSGLQHVFAYCEAFDAGNVRRWLEQRAQRPSASYVNWRGRPLRQVREEAALRQALATYLRDNVRATATMPAGAVRDALVAFVGGEQQAGRLTLTPPEPTPLGWRVRNFAHAIVGPLVALVLLPVFLV